MTSFKEFLEQRDPELYEQMLNEGVYDYLKQGAIGAGAIGGLALGMLGGGEAKAQDYLQSYPKDNAKPSIVKPSDDPYGNIAGRAKHMLGKKDQVTTDFDLIRDNYDKVIGITFNVEISAYTDPNRISKRDYDPSVTIKKLMYDTANSEAFRGMKLNLRLAREIYLNGQRVLENKPLPAFYFLDPNNNIIETEYKNYINVGKHPKEKDSQKMTITFYFTSNK